MSDEIIEFNNSAYYSTKKAAEEVEYSRDYISRLCRNDEVDARRVGRSWYVQIDSLKSYIEEQEKEKERRNEALSEELSQRYDKHTFDRSSEEKEAERRSHAASSFGVPENSTAEKSASEEETVFGVEIPHLAAGMVALMLSGVFGWTSFHMTNGETNVVSQSHGHDTHQTHEPSDSKNVLRIFAQALVSETKLTIVQPFSYLFNGDSRASTDTFSATAGEGADHVFAEEDTVGGYFQNAMSGVQEVGEDIETVIRGVGPTVNQSIHTEKSHIIGLMQSIYPVNNVFTQFGFVLKGGMNESSGSDLSRPASRSGTRDGVTVFDQKTGSRYCLTADGSEITREPGSCDEEVSIQEKESTTTPMNSAATTSATTTDHDRPLFPEFD